MLCPTISVPCRHNTHTRWQSCFHLRQIDSLCIESAIVVTMMTDHVWFTLSVIQVRDVSVSETVPSHTSVHSSSYIIQPTLTCVHSGTDRGSECTMLQTVLLAHNLTKPRQHRPTLRWFQSLLRSHERHQSLSVTCNTTAFYHLSKTNRYFKKVN